MKKQFRILLALLLMFGIILSSLVGLLPAGLVKILTNENWFGVIPMAVWFVVSVFMFIILWRGVWIEVLKPLFRQRKCPAQSPVISLPNNITPERFKFLKEKLAEYEVRLVAEEKANRYVPPEFWPDTRYKISILKTVLEKGMVETWDKWYELDKELQYTNQHAFRLACKVIADYIETGGENVFGTPKPTT